MAVHPARKRALDQRKRGQRGGRPSKEDTVAAAIDPRRPKTDRHFKDRDKAVQSLYGDD